MSGAAADSGQAMATGSSPAVAGGQRIFGFSRAMVAFAGPDTFLRQFTVTDIGIGQVTVPGGGPLADLDGDSSGAVLAGVCTNHVSPYRRGEAHRIGDLSATIGERLRASRL